MQLSSLTRIWLKMFFHTIEIQIVRGRKTGCLFLASVINTVVPCRIFSWNVTINFIWNEVCLSSAIKSLVIRYWDVISVSFWRAKIDIFLKQDFTITSSKIYLEELNLLYGSCHNELCFEEKKKQRFQLPWVVIKILLVFACIELHEFLF